MKVVYRYVTTCALLMVGLTVATLFAQQPSSKKKPFQPKILQQKKKPLKKPQKKRRRNPLIIPKVTKDKVICFALYTLHHDILKLTAQFYPLDDDDAKVARLEVMKNGKWVEIAKTKIIKRGWTAPFRIEKWDSTKDVKYRVAHGKTAFYTGLIRHDPVDKEVIVVAAFTGNSNQNRGPRPDLIKNIKAQDPDLLFFSGDQVYDHGKHYAAWLLFGRQFGEIIRNRPTITIPDDHDIGQGNVWGASGKVSKTMAGHDGGYFFPPEFVNEVQRAQTSHLPDPYDPTPVKRGITVYYTSLNWGRISFAILEDRKFKSGPSGIIPKMGPRPDHINDPKYDPKKIDVPQAVLLGKRQLKYLRHYSTDWKDVEMKAVLSQTVFAGAAHIHHGKRLIADLDSNGWPQTGRNKALREIRRGYALMIGGDQHLATVIQHGVDDWNDSGWSFCVPSILNYYPRKWLPLEKGINPIKGILQHTGQFKDGFANKVTMHAYANPAPDNYRASGHGIIRFNKKTRKITMECWPRLIDVTSPTAKQFPGWPIIIDQQDNYARKAVAYLPTLKIKGPANQVVQIVDQSNGEAIYTLRILGNSFRPKVFKKGKYTIHIGEGKSKQTLKDVESIDSQVKVKPLVVNMK